MFEKIKGLFARRGKMEFENPTLRVQHPEIATPDPIQPLRPYFQESRANAMAPTKSRRDFSVSAYSPSVDETDSTPWLAARNFDMRPGVAQGKKYAAVPRIRPDSIEPIIPYGTKVRVGNDEYEVRDMMNRRYAGQHMMDLFLPDKQQALKFGRQRLPVEY